MNKEENLEAGLSNAANPTDGQSIDFVSGCHVADPGFVSSMSGWIKLHRSINENPRSKDPEWFALWVKMLLKASFSENLQVIFLGKRITLKPGQFISSIRDLAYETGINRRKIERLLTLFESETQIGTQKTNVSTLFTITNWEKYQELGTQSGTRAGHERDTSGTPILDKEGKEGKEDIHTLSAAREIPSLDQVLQYCASAGIKPMDGEAFYAQMEGNGWTNGGRPVVKWQATIRSWHLKGFLPSQKVNGKPTPPTAPKAPKFDPKNNGEWVKW